MKDVKYYLKKQKTLFNLQSIKRFPNSMLLVLELPWQVKGVTNRANIDTRIALKTRNISSKFTTAETLNPVEISGQRG